MADLPFAFDASKYPPEDTQSPSPAPSSPQTEDNSLGLFSATPPEGQSAPQPDNSFDPSDPYNIPNAQPINPGAPRKRSRFVRCQWIDGVLVIEDIPDGFTDEERDILLEWYPKLQGKPSPHVDNSHGIVINGDDCLKHVAAVVKQETKDAKKARREVRNQQSAGQTRFAAAHMEWIAECQVRKSAIQDLQMEVRELRLQRKDAIAQLTAHWDVIVREAEGRLLEAKSTPAPDRPDRSDFT